MQKFSRQFLLHRGEFIIKKHQRDITKFVKGVYFAYFGTIIGDQDKSWAPLRYTTFVLKILGSDPKKRKQLSDLLFQ